MSRIKAIAIKDYKKIRALDLTGTDRAIVVLGGKNGQGKSSALDAIAVALGGTALLPPEPIRQGSDKAEVSVTLDDGTVVKRTVTRKEDGTYGGSLTIRTADGMSPRGPQGWLDARLGNLAVDPLAFMLLPPEGQAKRLRAVTGLNFAVLDDRKRALTEERRDLGRDGLREKGVLEALPSYPDAPPEPVVPQRIEPAIVSASRALADLEAARATERAARDAAATAAGADLGREAAERAVVAQQAHVADLEAKLARAREQLGLLEAESAKARQSAQEAAGRAEAARAGVVDPAPLLAALNDLEAANERIRAEAEAANADAASAARAANAKLEANRRRSAQAAKVEELRAAYAGKTAAIQAIEDEKAAKLAAAALPVPGLGFAEDGVTLNGLPLEQAGKAEQLRVSMALALAGNPEIRVVLIRDASLLDDDSLALVAQMAGERQAQVWLERVGDRDPGVIVIEDGGVR